MKIGAAGEHRITLRPAIEADWPLIRRWLAMPEIQRWWGNLASAKAEIQLAFQSNAAMTCLILADGEPIGYAHAIDAAYWGSALPDGMPAGSWDVDLFVAAPAYRGTGAGERALDLLANEVFATTLAPALSVFVSVRNEAAVRAYERAGFRWVRVWEDPLDGPSWMMLRERPRT